MSTLRFEWDEQTAIVNAKKHGVSFDEARSVFVDERAKLIDPSSTLTARKSLIRLDLWLKAQTTKQARTGRQALVPVVEGQ